MMRKSGKIELRQSEGGFTIIEMLVAISLLVIAMVSLAMALSTGLRTTVTTQTRMLARQVGASEIDKVRSMKFEAVGINYATETFASPGPTSPDQSFTIAPDTGLHGLYAGPETVSMTTKAGNTFFSVTRDVRKVTNRRNGAETYSYAKKIIITVSWSSPEPEGSEEFTTIVGATEMTP